MNVDSIMPAKERQLSTTDLTNAKAATLEIHVEEGYVGSLFQRRDGDYLGLLMSLVCLFLRRNYSNYHTLHSHCRSGNKSLNLRIHHRRNQGCYIHWHNYFHSRFRSLHRFLPGNRVNYMKAIGSWHLILRLIEPVLEVQMMWLILRTGIFYHPPLKVWVQDELLRRRMTWVLMAKTP